jgi:hypothetical protein
MKKTILTICAVVGISAVAFAQGSVFLQSSTTLGGINTNTISDAAVSGWFTGTMGLEVFAAPSNTVTVSDISIINADYNNPNAAITALSLDGWVLQSLPGVGAGATNVTVSGGSFSIGPVNIGTSGSITTGNSYIYAILGSATINSILEEGVLVFNPSASGAPAPGTPVNDEYTWPAQNLLLTPVPEPATLAIAALGGLSLLGLRRRKA